MKKTLLFFLLLLFALLLTATALAHSGGTDSQGGHTNQSTGEYHFHHGYSAHQHEDIDGDGVLDCPYDFVDNTEESTGTYSESSEKIVIEIPELSVTPPVVKPPILPSETSEKSNNDNEQKNQFDPSNSLPFIFGIILFSVGLMFVPVVISGIKSRRKEKRERRRLEEEHKQVKQFEKEYLEKLKNKKDWF